jgi:hypothetical protein
MWAMDVRGEHNEWRCIDCEERGDRNGFVGIYIDSSHSSLQIKIQYCPSLRTR